MALKAKYDRHIIPAEDTVGIDIHHPARMVRIDMPESAKRTLDTFRREINDWPTRAAVLQGMLDDMVKLHPVVSGILKLFDIFITPGTERSNALTVAALSYRAALELEAGQKEPDRKFTIILITIADTLDELRGYNSKLIVAQSILT